MMARAKTICAVSGCPKPQHRMGRCEVHAAEVEARRGTSTERGYGSAHQRRRAELLRRFVNTPCPTCGKIMHRWQKLEAGHSTPLWVDPASVADVLQHQACNPRGQDPRRGV